MRLELEGHGRTGDKRSPKYWLLFPLAVVAGIAASWPITLPSGDTTVQTLMAAPTASAANAALLVTHDLSVPSASSVRFKDEAADTDASTF